MRRKKAREARIKISLKDQFEFIRDLITVFPEIKDAILDEDNLDSITLQMIEYKVFTQKAIDSGNLSTVKKCFDFVNEQFDKVEHSVKNALAITYLWHLKINPGSSVERLLPLQFKAIIKDIDDRLKS